jgi:CheY-like chemotaxis protein/two-component sensor histidine kinase
MADLLLDTTLDEHQRDYVRIIKGCGDSLLTLINEILDLSKIESGKFTFDHEEFDLASVIEDVAELLAPKAFEKNIDMILAVSPKVPNRVMGDAYHLRQVIINLVGNAVKFTEFGSITVGAELLGQRDGKANVRIFVRDTGVGIPKERQSAIFESFTQGDGSTRRKFGGTGLGLTISRKLIELFGGTLELESEEGEGSTFSFDLGIEAIPQEQPVLNIASEGRVLILEPCDVLFNSLSENLAVWGCEAIQAKTGREALGSISKDPSFQTIMIDNDIPDMEVAEMLMALRLMKDLQELNLVLLLPVGEPAPAFPNASKTPITVLSKPIKRVPLYDAVKGRLTSRKLGRDSQIPQGQPLKGLRVLVAEDDRVSQKLSVRLLERLGATAEYVSNGRQVLERLKAHEYDIIVMDCNMPVMDGWQTTRQIRRNEEGTGNRIPIVALTANAMPGDRENCLAAGMDEYTSKPIKPAELVTAISKYTGVEKAA